VIKPNISNMETRRWGVRGREARGQRPAAEFDLEQNDNTATDCVGDRHLPREKMAETRASFPPITAVAT